LKLSSEVMDYFPIRRAARQAIAGHECRNKRQRTVAGPDPAASAARRCRSCGL
jgi:hypothetical protein